MRLYSKRVIETSANLREIKNFFFYQASLIRMTGCHIEAVVATNWDWYRPVSNIPQNLFKKILYPKRLWTSPAPKTMCLADSVHLVKNGIALATPSKLKHVRDVTATPVERQEDSVEKMTNAPVSEESIFLWSEHALNKPCVVVEIIYVLVFCCTKKQPQSTVTQYKVLHTKVKRSTIIIATETPRDASI